MGQEGDWLELGDGVPADAWSSDLSFRDHWGELQDQWRQLGELVNGCSKGEQERTRGWAEEVSGEVNRAFISGGKGRDTAIDTAAYVKFFARAVQAMGNVIKIGQGLEQGEGIVDRGGEFDPVKLAEWSKEMVETVMIPQCPRSHWLIEQGLIAREIWQQRNNSIPERLAWLRVFYQHVMKLGVYRAELGKQAYSADEKLERARIVSAVKERLGWRAMIDSVFFLGPGDGWRVDGPVINELKEDGVIGHDVVANGIDLNEINESHPEISLEQRDLLEVLEEHPEWKDKFELLFEIGSSRSNMDLIIVQDRYWAALAKLAKRGAIYVMDDAAIEPIEMSNRRVSHSRQMEKRGGVAGDAPVNKAYFRDDVDTPETVGARIVPILEKIIMARRHGFKCINLPEIGTDEWWELTANIQDPEWLKLNTKEIPNALKMPFYYAGETDEGDIARLTLIFEKVDDGQADLLPVPLMN